MASSQPSILAPLGSDDDRPSMRAVTSSVEPAKSVRLDEIHRLRGLAILMIVAAHAYQFFHWTNHPRVENLFKDLFDDASLIFVFIAGFLFQHVEKHRASYTSYLRRKLRNVIVPYLVAVLPALVFLMVRGSEVLSEPPLRNMHFFGRLLYLVTYPGLTINYALWFIPVVTVYYLFSPLLKLVDRGHHYWVLFLLFPLSLLMHRPTHTSGHNLTLALYWLPGFILGMFVSRHRQRAFALLDAKLLHVTVVFALFFVGHLLLATHHGKSQTDTPFTARGPAGLVDWLYLQKVLMSFVLLGLFRRFRSRPARVLDFLAGSSYAIFFYHLYVVYLLRWITRFTAPAFRLDYFILIFSLAVGLPCLLVFVARRFVPRWSRTLLGA